MRSENHPAASQQGGIRISPPGATGAFLPKKLASAALDITSILNGRRSGTTIGKLHLHHRVQNAGFHIDVKTAIRQFGLGNLFPGLIENVYDSHIVFPYLLVFL